MTRDRARAFRAQYADLREQVRRGDAAARAVLLDLIEERDLVRRARFEVQARDELFAAIAVLYPQNTSRVLAQAQAHGNYFRSRGGFFVFVMATEDLVPRYFVFDDWASPWSLGGFTNGMPYILLRAYPRRLSQTRTNETVPQTTFEIEARRALEGKASSVTADHDGNISWPEGAARLAQLRPAYRRYLERLARVSRGEFRGSGADTAGAFIAARRRPT